MARHLQRLEYVAKPATTLFLAGAAVAGDATPWTIAALVACLAGDVFLMLPRDLFVAGLASFLLGHLLFVAGFVAAYESARWVPLTAVLAVAILGASAAPVLRGATAQDPKLRAPVLAYMAVIGAMVVASALPATALAVVAATVFMLSDSVLARDRFVRPLPHGHLAVMVTYHAALALLVLALA